MAVKYSSKHQQGFILASTLWALAVMFIVVGLFHSYTQRKLALGLQAKTHLQQTLDSLSTEQTLLYLLATARMTRAGLTLSYQNEEQYLSEEGFLRTDPVGDEIALDNTPYQGLGDIQFSIQDTAGLVSINAADTSDIEKLLEIFEPSPVVRSQLIGALQDYIDANDLLSLSGAEQQDYRTKGLLVPTNDYLRSEVELTRVMGWQPWLQAHPAFDLQNWFSIRRIGIININTMSKTLLIQLLGMREADAELFVQERKTNPVSSESEFALRFNLSPQLFNEEKYRNFPSNELRMRFWNKGGGQARLISLQLTPNGLMGPWQVDYEYSVQSGNNNKEPLALRQTSLFDPPLGGDR